MFLMAGGRKDQAPSHADLFATAVSGCGSGLVGFGVGSLALKILRPVASAAAKGAQGLARLPVYVGGKVRGILETGARQVELISGRAGPMPRAFHGVRQGST